MTVTPTTRCQSCAVRLNFRERVTGLCRACDPSVERLHVVGRLLTCTGCRKRVDVLEACMGARTVVEHRWVNPATYRCAGCTDTEFAA